MYEIFFLIWLGDPLDDSLSMKTIIICSMCELILNITNAAVLTLMGYMMNKMTEIPEENYIEPITNKKVPFIVHLASIKLVNDFLKS